MTDSTLVVEEQAGGNVPSASATRAGVRASRIVSGGFWGVVGQIATLVASVLATRYNLRFLGTDQLGVLALVNLVVGYASVGDMGMSQASTKFGAEAYAGGEPREESAVIWTAVAVLSVPASLLAALLFVGASPIADYLLHVPTDIRGEAVAALRLASIVLLMRSMAGVLNTPQTVRLRLDLVSLINNGGAVLQIVAIPLVLWWFQGGVSAAVAVVAVVTTGMALAHATLAVRLLPALRHPRFARPLASVLLRYGGSTVLITLLSLVLFNMEKFVVSGLVSATALAYYAVAFQVTRMLAILPGAIGQALLPAFARLQVDADRRPLQHLFDRSLRWLLLVNLPAAAILIALGRPILAAWLDPDFAAHAAVPLAILAAGSVINALVYVPLMLLQGVGRLDFIVRYSALMLAPYAVAVFVLVHFLGINGAAYAWTARSIVECALMLHAARKAVGVSITEKRALAWSVAPALLVVALLLAAAPSLSATITGLAAGALAACLVYFLVSWTWILTSEEREWLTRTVGAFARRATAAAA